MIIPKHVAMILDGNRRWAKSKGFPVIEGHRKGADAIVKIVKKGKELGIRIGSFWAFSTENWNRSREEIQGLMQLFSLFLKEHSNKIIENKVRFIHIGRKDRLPKEIIDQIIQLEKNTSKYAEYYFILALDYGGRDEIIRAAKKIQNSIRQPADNILNLNEENFNQFLDTKDLPYPYPDLLIRTGGKMRLSGFMSWQSAYTELIFHPKYLPDFTPLDLELCIEEYSKRQRRYGR